MRELHENFSCETKHEIFSDQGINNIVEFSDTLKRIHIRLINEGYVIKDGKVYKLEDNTLNQ